MVTEENPLSGTGSEEFPCAKQEVRQVPGSVISSAA